MVISYQTNCPQPLPSSLCHFNPREFAQGEGERAAEGELRSLLQGLPFLFYIVLKITKTISLLGSSLERALLNFHALFAPLKLGKETPF